MIIDEINIGQKVFIAIANMRIGTIVRATLANDFAGAVSAHHETIGVRNKIANVLCCTVNVVVLQ
jgi:hypothetical protein